MCESREQKIYLLEEMTRFLENYEHVTVCLVFCVTSCMPFVVFLLQPGKSSSKQGSGIPSLAASKPSKLAPPSNFRQSTSSMTTASGSASTPKRPQSIPVPQTSPSADQVISLFSFV